MSNVFNFTFVPWFRSVAPYIHKFRNQTFVVGIAGEAIAAGKLHNLAQDLAMIQSMGVKLVLVHGFRPQVNEQLAANREQLLKQLGELSINMQSRLDGLREELLTKLLQNLAEQGKLQLDTVQGALKASSEQIGKSVVAPGTGRCHRLPAADAGRQATPQHAVEQQVGGMAQDARADHADGDPRYPQQHHHDNPTALRRQLFHQPQRRTAEVLRPRCGREHRR